MLVGKKANRKKKYKTEDLLVRVLKLYRELILTKKEILTHTIRRNPCLVGVF
jgi:hypothetical protein